MNDEKKYIDMLVDILNKQVSSLEAVLDITKKQEDIISSDEFDGDAFDETLSQKDIHIIRLNELDNGFVSIYEKVAKSIRNETGKFQKEIQSIQTLIRRCTDLSNEIKTLETRNKDKLSVYFSDKKKEYSVRQTAATVANKYNTTMKNVNVMNEGYRFNRDQ